MCENVLCWLMKINYVYWEVGFDGIVNVVRNSFEVEILGPSKIVYCGSGNQKPLMSCGARVVIETESEIKIIS